MRSMPRPIADRYALGFILLVSVVVTWPVTIGGRAMLPTGMYLRMQPWRAHASEFPEFKGPNNPLLDPVQQHYPWRVFASQAVRSGQVPLWNPQMLCGTPFLGNGQSAVFYPETWLHYFMDPLHALGWATTLFLFIAGSLMYLFLRTIGIHPIAGTIGAVTFMLNGFFVGWLCFPTMRSVMAWLPLMLLGVERYARSGRGAWLLLVALGCGLQFLAGHLHVSMYLLLVFGAYALARMLMMSSRGASRATVLRGLALTAGAVLLGTVVAAVQLAPVLEMTQQSSRSGGGSYEHLMSHSLAPPQALLGLMPDIYGNPVDQNHWGADLNTWWRRQYRAYSETSFYMGLGPLILALSGLFLRRRRQSWFWLGIAAFGLMLAFGTSANRLLYWLAPGYSQLPGIGRAVVMTNLAVAVLAALGVDSFVRRLVVPARTTFVITRVCVILLLIGLTGGMTVWVFTGQLESAGLSLGGYTLLQTGRFALILIASAGVILWAALSGRRHAWVLLIAIIAIDLGIFMQKFTPEGPIEYLDIRPAILSQMDTDAGNARVCSIGPDFLNRMSPNTGMLLSLEEIQGSDSLVWGRYQQLLTAISSERFGMTQVDPAFTALDWMNVRYLLTPLDIEQDGWRRIATYETNLYLNENALPRAFMADAVEVHGSVPGLLRAAASAEASPRTLHLLRTDGGGLPDQPAPGEVSVTEYGINRIVVGGEMPADGVLFVSTANYPGWRAYVDGAQAPIVTANYAFQAVHLDRPAREVVLTFLPPSFQVGAFCTLLALALLAGLTVLTAGGRKRRE